MEVERVGPLSYTVEPEEGETNADRPIIVGILCTVALLALGLVGGWALLGVVADKRVAIDGFPLLTLVGALGATAYAARRHRPKARRQALLVVLGASVLAAIITNRSLATVKAATPQVRQALDAIHVPGFQVVSTETFGDRFCHHGCPRIDRRYRAPENVGDPVAAFMAELVAHGWEPPDGLDPKTATVADKGDLTVQVTEREPHVIEVSMQRES